MRRGIGTRVLVALAMGCPTGAGAQSGPADAAAPTFEQRSLPGGAELIAVVDPAATTVTVNLVFRGGTSSDPPRQAGRASLTATLLTHSTRNRTREQLARELEVLDARLAAAADVDHVIVTLEAPPAALPAALALMADVVLHPVLPADQLAFDVGRTRAAIANQSTSPRFQASRAFTRAVYGQHPYGRIETRSSLARIDVQDALREHRDHYRPNNAVFVVAGAVDADSVAASIASAFRGWVEAPVGLPSYHGLPDRSATERILVHVPGARTAVVRAGHAIAPEGDWLALRLATLVLGGDEGSRLDRALTPWAREAGAGLARRADAGYVQIRFEVAPEAVDSAVAAMIATVRELGARPPDPDELSRQREALAAALRGARATPRLLADRVAGSVLLGRGRDELLADEDRLARLGPDEVLDASRRIDADRMAVVVAGDAVALHDRLARLGPVHLQDDQGAALAIDDLRPRAREVALDGSSLRPGAWTYAVEAGGTTVGSIVRRLVEEPDGALTLETDATLGPQTVDRSVTFSRPGFAALRTDDRIAVQGQELRSALSVVEGRVLGSVVSPGERVDVDAPVVAGALLGEMVEAALWVAPLAEGAELLLPAVTGEGRAVNVKVRVVGERSVRVPAGEFDVWEVLLDREGQRQTVFVTREVPRMTVRTELDDPPLVTVLTRVDGGAP